MASRHAFPTCRGRGRNCEGDLADWTGSILTDVAATRDVIHRRSSPTQTKGNKPSVRLDLTAATSIIRAAYQLSDGYSARPLRRQVRPHGRELVQAGHLDHAEGHRGGRH